jgi:hypothetical protein
MRRVGKRRGEPGGNQGDRMNWVRPGGQFGDKLPMHRWVGPENWASQMRHSVTHRAMNLGSRR